MLNNIVYGISFIIHHVIAAVSGVFAGGFTAVSELSSGLF